MNSYLFDSSAWMEYFTNSPVALRSKLQARGVELFTSAFSLLEIRRKLLRRKTSFERISAILEFIKSKSAVVPVSPEICEAAADACEKWHLHAADAVIYCSALHVGAILVTADSDFEGLAGVELLA